MRFTRHSFDISDKTIITVDRWDDRVEISGDFLRTADPEMIRLEGEGIGEVVNISVANGWAQYRLLSVDGRADIGQWELIVAELNGRTVDAPQSRV